MKKPSEVLLKLIDLGQIRGIIIDYRQTGTDTAETFCEILGEGKGSVSGMWRTYSPFLEVTVGWASIARVNDRHRLEVDEWRKFEKKNTAELAEYSRLKAKFEGGAT